MEQLRFEGAEFARRLSATSAFIEVWAKEMLAHLSQPSLLLFNDWHKPSPILQLFDPPARCGEYVDISDEGYITCDLAEGHSGNHFDASTRIEWYPR